MKLGQTRIPWALVSLGTIGCGGAGAFRPGWCWIGRFWNEYALAPRWYDVPDCGLSFPVRG